MPDCPSIVHKILWWKYTQKTHLFRILLFVLKLERIHLFIICLSDQWSLIIKRWDISVTCRALPGRPGYPVVACGQWCIIKPLPHVTYTRLLDYQVVCTLTATKGNVFRAKMTLINRSSYIILWRQWWCKKTRVKVWQTWAAPGAPPWNGQ